MPRVSKLPPAWLLSAPGRFFLGSPAAANKKSQLDSEIKKLNQLRKDFNKAGVLEKFRLGTQLSLQQQKVLDLQFGNQSLRSIHLAVPESPLDLALSQRLRSVYLFLLDAYLRESALCKSSGLYKDDLAESLVAGFSSQYPQLAPITLLDVEQSFDAFNRILNSVNSVEDIQFLNPEAQSLFASFHAENHAASPGEVDENTVKVWADIHELFTSIPYAEDGSVSINPLVPPKVEYPYLNSLFKELLERRTFGPKSAFFSPKKPESPNQLKNSKKNKNSAYIDFDISAQHMRLFFLGLGGGFLLFMLYASQETNHEISFQEFTSDFLRKNLVRKIRVINNRTAILELNENANPDVSKPNDYYFTIGNIETFERNLRAVQDDFGVPDQIRIPVVYVTEGSTAKILVNFLPTLLFLGAIYYMTKKASMGGMGGPLGFGKSTAKKFNQEKDIKIKFKDVAGMNEAKEEVMEFVKFLQNPAKYEKLGAKIPRGAILSGPPGTGKTLIAKATAGEAGVPFFSVSGSEFVEMFVGVGASRVRDLFKTARENAPAIVFVDEIDAIGKQRSKGNASGANDERETTLNQLLVEMDGFETLDHVVVLAGTNRADILDKALMRPGRFDRHIAIDNPELEGRKQIFEVHLKKIKLVQNIDKDLPGRLAALTPGFSGADIANVCNEAALIAARYNAKSVTLRHFELAIERVIGGVEKKSKLLSPEEKKVVAYHEAGHAVCGWFLKHAHPLLKVSIIPRGQGALGYAQYLPPDQYLMSEAELMDRMVMTLGGRVSEELNFSTVTSGAYDDFKKVTGIAQSMVLRFGMSEKVGMVNYADTQGQDLLTKPFSDETNDVIDSEIRRLVEECHAKCKALLQEKSEAVRLVAEELLRKEFITRESMIRLLGKRPFPETNDAFDKYLDGNDAFKDDRSDSESGTSEAASDSGERESDSGERESDAGERESDAGERESDAGKRDSSPSGRDSEPSENNNLESESPRDSSKSNDSEDGQNGSEKNNHN